MFLVHIQTFGLHNIHNVLLVYGIFVLGDEDDTKDNAEGDKNGRDDRQDT